MWPPIRHLTIRAIAMWLAASPVWAGDPDALNRSAFKAYDGGDFATARTHWRQAATEGDTLAMTALANMYHHGEGTGRDLKAAKRWYAEAAEHGDVIGQLNLGDMLITGTGGARDLAAGHFWLSLAARQGNAWAAARRDEVAAKLSDRELARSRAHQDAWRPRR